mmetsp:Transcript_22929/g.39074  ORF Transcript_22929/g.39074 Transcript_22929/m.39074 type:complete len:86 (+) Transcript_22929:66-323(+)
MGHVISRTAVALRMHSSAPSIADGEACPQTSFVGVHARLVNANHHHVHAMQQNENAIQTCVDLVVLVLVNLMLLLEIDSDVETTT